MRDLALVGERRQRRLVGAPEVPARQLAQAEAGIEAAGAVVALDDEVDACAVPAALGSLWCEA